LVARTPCDREGVKLSPCGGISTFVSSLERGSAGPLEVRNENPSDRFLAKPRSTLDFLCVMKNNERSSNSATSTLKKFGWTILAVSLASAIYTASPVEAKPALQQPPSDTQEGFDPEASAPTEYEPSSEANDDFNNDYDVQHPSGGG
jgi:hypothetical protein